MKCQEAREKMFSYFDQEISLQEEEALFDHLSACVDCGIEFGNVEETHHLLQNLLVPVAPPPDLTERIMARIPLSPAEYIEVPAGWGFRLKQYAAGLKERWKNGLGTWQLKTAVVTMGLLALFVFQGMLDGLQQPQKLPSDADVAYVDPNDPVEETPPAEGSAPVDTPVDVPVDEEPADKEPDGAGDKAPGEEKGKPAEEASQAPPEAGQEPTKVVPDSTTNMLDLPRASSRENRVETIEVVSLVESNGQDVSNPVLSEDGQYIHYLYDNAGMKEEWEIERKSGALPQKAQSNLLGKGKAESDNRIPEWLRDMDMVKEAKSKLVAWSSDKKQVALNLNSTGTDNDGLWIGQADGSGMMHVAQEGGGNDLVWAPDGMKVAFTDGADNLYVIYLRENLLIQVTDGDGGLVNLTRLLWTPDAKEVIFQGEKAADGTLGIYRVALP